MRRVGGTACLLALAALVGGCGGAVTKRDFIARADAICTNAVRKTRSITPPSFTTSASDQLSALGRYLEEVLPVVQAEATQIRALHRHAQDARDSSALTRYLTALAQTAGDYRALAAATNRGDPQGVASAEADLRASPIATLAASYGLHSCGAPGATVA